jgi:hypothetical protein
MRRLWSFIEQKSNREILGWVGGGLVIIVAGLWTAFVYFAAPEKTASTPGVSANCGSVGVGGNVSGATITASNTGSCPDQNTGAKP